MEDFDQKVQALKTTDEWITNSLETRCKDIEDLILDMAQTCRALEKTLKLERMELSSLGRTCIQQRKEARRTGNKDDEAKAAKC